MRLTELNEGVIGDLVSKYKKWKEKNKQDHLLKVWDAKSDPAIQTAFDDATQWSKSLDLLGDDSKVLTNMKKDVDDRLEKFILPQMKKRGMKK